MGATPKMTEAQGRIALDLARTASERCQQTMLDSIRLCEHPVQQWTIGLQVAAMALGAVGGAIGKQRPELSYGECQETAFELLKGMLDGSIRASLTEPTPKDRPDERD